MNISRRSLLQGASAASLVSPALSAWAVSQGGQVVATQGKPQEPSWMRDLFARGKPDWVGKEHLKWIGMPVGGICCGQLYLGGDGTLWLWDLWNQPEGWDMLNLSSGKHYANPMEPKSPLGFGLAVFVNGEPIPLSSKGFQDVAFRGEYPIGRVRYKGHDLAVELEAFSPFIPLNTDDSSLPLTVLRYTVRNTGSKSINLAVGGGLENIIGQFSGRQAEIVRVNQRISGPGYSALVVSAKRLPTPAQELRKEIVFESFDGSTYGPWKVEGTAFGDGPYEAKDLPERYRTANPIGKAFVCTHNAHNGEDSVQADLHLGKLTSPKFTISRRYVNFRIGGGNHPEKTCINLIIDGKVAFTSTGRNTLQLRQDWFDVSEHEGKSAHFEIIDAETGGWGHISIDQIIFADRAFEDSPLEERSDWGQMAFIAMNPQAIVQTDRSTFAAEETPAEAQKTGPGPFWGGVFQKAAIPAGASKTLEFVVAWYFPGYGKPSGSFAEITDISKLKKHYAKRFKSVIDVVSYYAKNRQRLVSQTQLWSKTWYDSTLPYWFLDRSFISIDCLATATAHRFDNGRFYGWEGVYCCPGTCQHVWNYAQAMARIFPELERSVRAQVDFGLAWRPDGAIDYRGESGRHIAHDGLCGTLMRTYREHSMTPDNSWLRAIWPRVKKSIERLIAEDKDRDGMLEGEQYNTLDASWFGKISWISSMYIATLRCGTKMANDMGESNLAKEWEVLAQKGAKAITDATFNGEYYAMVRDPAHPKAPGSGPGCHIDQVFGDSFLRQIGLDPLLPHDKVASALSSLWKYNFTLDAGAYMNTMQSKIKGGRWYAMPGEAGLLMTSWPRGGASDAKGEGNPDWMVGYFNECMNGFEYQVAAHMIAEGMPREGFAIMRALNERYSATKRNPYNEVECSDHYSRSMASYGAFLTACGFHFHGPSGELGFAPKVNPDHFRAPFTTALGWGTFEQRRSSKTFEASLNLHYGKLRLTKLNLEIGALSGQTLKVTANAQPVDHKVNDNDLSILFDPQTTLSAGRKLQIRVTVAT